MVGRPATRRRLAALTLVLALLAPTGLSAAAATSGTTQPADGDAVGTEADVHFARTVEEMKGHLAMSVRYRRANETETAAMHAHHPSEEYWSAIGSEVRERNASLAADLQSALEAAPDHARNDTPSEYAAYVHGTLYPLLDRAEASVVSANVTNATFNAKVSAALLERATQEYDEGVADNGTIVEREEYDDARGFVVRADALYAAHVRPTFDDHATEEVDDLFDALNGSVAASKPPEDVEHVTDSIAAEYGEYAGIETASDGSETQAEQTVDAIEEHLHEAVEAYEAGKVSKAKSIVRQTYLSYFESLEGDLIEKRPALVKDLESDFNEDLPGLMAQNASASDVEGKVDEMNGKLATAERVLSTENESTISLGNDSATTTATPTTEQTSTASPGFGVALALVAALGAALVTLRRID